MRNNHLSADQQSRLKRYLVAHPGEDGLTVDLLRCTGMRQGELVLLTRSSFDLVHGSVAIRALKGSANRTIPLSPYARELLTKVLEYKGFTTYGEFISNSPKVLSQLRLVQNIFNRVMTEALGVDHGFKTHSLRHTFALRCYEHFDKDIRKVMLVMGHKSITSTIKYLMSLDLEVAMSQVSEIMG